MIADGTVSIHFSYKFLSIGLLLSESIPHAITTAATNTDIFGTVIMMMVYNSFPPLLTLGVLCQTVKIILCQKSVQLLVTM